MKSRIVPLAGIMRSRITRWGIVPLLVTAILTTLTPWSVQPAAAQSGTDRLYTHERLYKGQYLSSPNGMYELRMQWDGNLVIYRITSSVVPIWSTRTDFSPIEGQYKWLGNQEDGNLVIYTEAEPPGPGRRVYPERALWDSGTGGQGGSTLIMQDDGNLVLYKNGGGVTWASHTASGLQPGWCSPANVFLGTYYNVPTPSTPTLDGQRPDAWLHALGRVSSWSAPCGAWMQTIIERKQCGTFGCSWVDRATSPKVPLNQRGWTFAGVQTVCKEGIHTYRVRVDVGRVTIGDDGGASAKSTWGPWAVTNCTGTGR